VGVPEEKVLQILKGFKLDMRAAEMRFNLDMLDAEMCHNTERDQLETEAVESRKTIQAMSFELEVLNVEL
jgi:hypothetical protein